MVPCTFFSKILTKKFEELEEGVYSYLCVLRNG